MITKAARSITSVRIPKILQELYRDEIAAWASFNKREAVCSEAFIRARV
ncbi:hypothetical protein [Bradyrhizobium ottawaense]